MAINVDVRLARSVPRINNEGLTLVVFKNARKKSDIEDTIVRINSAKELYDSFEVFDGTDTEKFAGARELYCAEYLLAMGVNLLCYPTDTRGTIAAGDITNIEDIAVLDYKFVVVPYAFADAGLSGVVTMIKDIDAQLFTDLIPNGDAAAVTTAITALGTDVSKKVEIFVNGGVSSFTSEYLEDTEVVFSPFDSETVFIGIPASITAVARKANLLNKRTPWLPVAGETNGMTPEFTKLARKLSTAEKVAFQAAGANVLFTKTGIGSMFVSQNTLHDTENDMDPFIRSHVVTLALWVKRELSKIANKAMYAPNIQKTWNMFSLSATSILNYALESNGIEEFRVFIGEGSTMTTEDINNGIMKATIRMLPIRVVEAINISLVIQATEDSFEIEIGGE